MGDYWKDNGIDNGIEKPQAIIVCAACKCETIILCGARHWDRIMRKQFADMMLPIATTEFEQGFIDQFGVFYNRKDALQIVKENGQPYDGNRNGSFHELYSEGLY